MAVEWERIHFWNKIFFKGVYVFLALFVICNNTPVSALEIDIGGGEISGSFDTTISAGASWRVEKRDKDLIGLYNGGNNYHVNGDDGNLNYDRGLVSQVTKVLHELDLNYRNFGFFGRVHYFYDSENANKDELSGDAKEEIGAHVDILDAYFTGDFDMWDRFLNMRLGNQVLSWGESTFIQNGMNIINPVDVSMLRSPGSELKDALIPIPMVSGSLDIIENVSIAGFYQFAFEETEIDPAGTYFSVYDILGDGGEVLWLGPEGTPGAGIPRSDRDARVAVSTESHYSGLFLK